MKIFILIFSFFLFATNVIFAQETPQKYGITFPVSELGSCKDLTECKTFCDDPVNKEACISFAKTKGFYKEDEKKAKKAQIVEQAKGELGCDSETSCKVLCERAENRDKCSSFAKKVGLAKAAVSVKSPEVLEKAKAALGCDSLESCKSFCSQEENREKCTNFAKDAGLKGGTEFRGPGGCTSEETCKSFCSDPTNFSLCSNYGQAVGKKFTGIGGCQNEAECKSVCEKNPEACKGSGGPTTSVVGENSQTTTTFSPEDRCNKTPNCSWADNNCKCNFTPQAAKEYENVCKE
ncbi:MAG: hypothetical protein Q7S79_02970, partial [bacterium]|nr:hypothetical protein [bacterium]